ncbi:hypothetical protein ACFWVC_33415 [Streptomyces sp. NPDC058691]|uniref:hypothetical protein n=1 Tax=Streptomyces sp. NPDC058691 TaxID=3346601 RepID=UPI00365760F0
MPDDSADAVRRAAQHLADVLTALEHEEDERNALAWLHGAVRSLHDVCGGTDPADPARRIALVKLGRRLDDLQLAVLEHQYGRTAAPEEQPSASAAGERPAKVSPAPAATPGAPADPAPRAPAPSRAPGRGASRAAVPAELRMLTEAWWPEAPGEERRPARFHPELPGLHPKVAKERLRNAGTPEGLARGLRLDALRVNPGDEASPLRDLEKALGTRSPADALLPGCGDVLQAVAIPGSGQAGDLLPSLWPELIALVAPAADPQDASPPHTESTEETGALGRIVAGAVELVTVVDESIRTGCGSLALIDQPAGDQGVRQLDEQRVRSWKKRLYQCLRTLRRQSPGRAAGPGREAHVEALVQLDEVLAQIVPDPVPPRDSWWERRRREAVEQAGILLKAEGAEQRGGFANYQTKENLDSLVQDSITVYGRGDTAEVLWWIRLPYVITRQDAAVLRPGRVIWTPRGHG